MLDVRACGKQDGEHQQRHAKDAAHNSEREDQARDCEHDGREDHASDRVSVDVRAVASRCHTLDALPEKV
jgi:hypothetical protein